VTPLISVVIPTYRRPELLSRCLEVVLNQDLESVRYEVIVVDDEGSALTRALVESRSNDGHGVEVSYLTTGGRRGPATARNLGWRAARGDIVAFTDDDCIPAASWLSEGLKAFREGVSGVSGRVIVPLPPAPTDSEYNLTGLERSRFVTANCFYRRLALIEAGGFDERFETAWREDSDLQFTLLERGSILLDGPDAVVVHPTRDGGFSASIRDQRKSMYNALLYKKHPDQYRRYIQRTPPLGYYSTLASLVMLATGFVLGRRRVASYAAMTWLLQTLLFAGRRLRYTSRAPGHVFQMLITSAVIPVLSVYWRLRGAVRYRVLFF
jgi:glycosyltransferase involved in cell wall biosynthesis